ncbi:hypothetical protein [Kocuria flava]|uniref:hypothetical protein n=1 Tax=Kocuria flava TaxID=446860 RepID=UPI00215186C6|nr:hypothetical protein [Kocuria flava]
MAEMTRHPFSLAAALLLCAVPLAACDSSSEAPQNSPEATVTTAPPQLGEGTFTTPTMPTAPMWIPPPRSPP